MSNDDKVLAVLPAIIVGIVCLFFGIVSGAIIDKWMVVDSLRAKAVELHAAEWVVDQKTGETKFTWKEAKP